jgi:hypothetical protein
MTGERPARRFPTPRIDMSAHLPLRARLRATLDAHSEQRQLERELASYDTPADRLELDAILRRHTPAQRCRVDAALDRLAIRRS